MGSAPGMSVPVPPAEPTRWPLIVGVIGLVYGGLGCCADTFFLAATAFSPWFASLMGIKNPPEMPNQAIFLVSTLATLALCILLVVGSVQLLRRRASARSTLMAWVVARLVMLVVGLVIGFATLQGQVDYGEKWDQTVKAMVEERQPGATAKMPPFDRKRQELMARYSLVGMSVLFLAYPLFLGVLLTNRAKRAEIESWRNELR